jgi:hypothetical protein
MGLRLIGINFLVGNSKMENYYLDAECLLKSFFISQMIKMDFVQNLMVNFFDYDLLLNQRWFNSLIYPWSNV